MDSGEQNFHFSIIWIFLFLKGQDYFPWLFHDWIRKWSSRKYNARPFLEVCNFYPLNNLKGKLYFYGLVFGKLLFQDSRENLYYRFLSSISIFGIKTKVAILIKCSLLIIGRCWEKPASYFYLWIMNFTKYKCNMSIPYLRYDYIILYIQILPFYS